MISPPEPPHPRPGVAPAPTPQQRRPCRRAPADLGPLRGPVSGSGAPPSRFGGYRPPAVARARPLRGLRRALKRYAALLRPPLVAPAARGPVAPGGAAAPGPGLLGASLGLARRRCLRAARSACRGRAPPVAPVPRLRPRPSALRRPQQRSAGRALGPAPLGPAPWRRAPCGRPGWLGPGPAQRGPGAGPRRAVPLRGPAAGSPPPAAAAAPAGPCLRSSGPGAGRGPCGAPSDRAAPGPGVRLPPPAGGGGPPPGGQAKKAVTDGLPPLSPDALRGPAYRPNWGGGCGPHALDRGAVAPAYHRPALPISWSAMA